MQRYQFAIVGGGFSGLAVAAQLLQQVRQPARICLINRTARLGRGLAYGTNSSSLVLNVPAARMSLYPDSPDDFAEYLCRRELPYRGHDFVPRCHYGEYLEATVAVAQGQAAPGVTLETIRAEIHDVEPARPMAGEHRFLLHRAAQPPIEAAEVILAMGNFLPGKPAAPTSADWGAGDLIADPWACGALAGIKADADVVLLGSGLTACDVALQLLDQGHIGKLTMLSRRGLLPQPHRVQESAPAASLVPGDFLTGLTGAREQMRAVRKLIRVATDIGYDWRDVVGGLRPITPRLWQQMTTEGRRQFVRHIGPYWDTHRHRAAPAIFSRIEQALQSGRIGLRCGRLLEVAGGAGQGLRIAWRARGQSDRQWLAAGVMVNCTGPSNDLKACDDPLICNLRRAGMVRVDAMGMGLEVSCDYHLLDAGGNLVHGLRYVGPLLKAQHWEATAVPELRMHAKSLVAAMLSGRAIARQAGYKHWGLQPAG